MDLTRQIIGLTAAALTCIGSVAYVGSIVRRTNSTRWPSWLIWTVASAVSLATYYESGARESAWVSFAYVGVCAVTLAAALWRQSPGGITKMEIACLCGAAVSLLMWWLSGSAVIGQVVCVSVEIVAYIPVWLTARHENRLAWCLETAGSMVNMFAIAHASFGLLLHPAAILVCNGIVVALLPWRTSQKIASPDEQLEPTVSVQ